MTADSSTAADDVSTVTVPPPECGGGSDDCNGGEVLKSVWNKPLEGSGSTVMGAESWPALSESTRFGFKSSSGSEAFSQARVISQPPQKPVVKPSSNLNPHNNNNNNHPNNGRHRAMKLGGRPTAPPPRPLFLLFDVYGNLLPASSEFPQPSFKSNNWSPRYDRTSNRNPARRNNFGPRAFGYGGRRDHYGPRSDGTRDVHLPHQMGLSPPVRGFVRPPFIPRPLRPYGAPMGYGTYEMGASYVYVPVLASGLYRGRAPVFTHGESGSAMFIPYWDSSLHGLILRQIEYYFSDENLVKDSFLRSHMDDEGWVPISLIAGFQRVQKLTNDVQMILSSLAYSNTVEVLGDKIRRRIDWRRWIHISREAIVEEASLQKLTLEDRLADEIQVLANGDASYEDPCS